MHSIVMVKIAHAVSIKGVSKNIQVCLAVATACSNRFLKVRYESVTIKNIV